MKMMKKTMAIAAIMLSVSANAQLTKVDSVSYLVGMNIGASIMKDFSEANVNLLVKGLQDAMTKQAPMCADPGNEMLNSFFQQKQQLAQAEEEKNAMAYKAVGEEFLAKNAKRKGVEVLQKSNKIPLLLREANSKPHLTWTNSEMETWANIES